MYKKWLVLVFIFLSGVVVFGQKNKKPKTEVNEDDKKQRTFVTIGPEVNLVIPTDFGARPDKFYNDTMFKFYPNIGFRFGACLRFDFSRTFSFQTGLYYINRSYTAQVGRSNAIKTEIETEYFNRQVNYTGFELPIMALFYVQLGKQWFMNNAVGVSIDFYPSSIVKHANDSNVKYVVYGGRNSWCVPSLKAAIGFEYRSESAGYFYLGGQFHRPFFPIMDGFIERTNPLPYGLQSVDIPQTGTYFSVDLKYFFPPGKKNKWTESNKR